MTMALGTQDALLLVFANDGSCLGDMGIGGERDEASRWDLGSRFVLLTDDGEQFRVNGWCCTIETGVSA